VTWEPTSPSRQHGQTHKQTQRLLRPLVGASRRAAPLSPLPPSALLTATCRGGVANRCARHQRRWYNSPTTLWTTHSTTTPPAQVALKSRPRPAAEASASQPASRRGLWLPPFGHIRARLASRMRILADGQHYETVRLRWPPLPVCLRRTGPPQKLGKCFAPAGVVLIANLIVMILDYLNRLRLCPFPSAVGRPRTSVTSSTRLNST
jgi:hypothetical protein